MVRDRLPKRSNLVARRHLAFLWLIPSPTVNSDDLIYESAYLSYDRRTVASEYIHK